ncbi:MAG: UDP-forming cellulose synthase catalytic subunit [Pseudomonadota bacterium]
MAKSIRPKGGILTILLWLCVVSMLVLMITVPTSVEVQALLGLTGFLVVLLLKPFAEFRTARLVMLAAASTLVLRYWFWRLFETLPGLEDPWSFAAAVTLFAVETYAIGIFFLSSILMGNPIRRQPPPPVAVNHLPKVDILVPSLNEPASLLAVTLAAAKNIAYPDHLKTVVLCDDGGTDARCASDDVFEASNAKRRRDELRQLCDKLGVVYMTRAENRGAKAGNLNEAMSRLDGDLVVIFDADHAPTRDFLARTVGYFVQDPELFLVQTPHFFLNQDPVARNLELSKSSPPEYEMFYNGLQMGLDQWEGTFFCGSAAVLRRAALDEVGGISGRTITEDAETSLKVQAKGWKSIYVNHAMVAGLQPETFAMFLQQRGRWATGMIQLLMLSNPLTMRGLNLWQRLCYFNSMSFWLFPIVRMVLLLTPLVYLFFDLELLVTTANEAFVFMAGYLAVAILVQNALFGRSRWPFVSEIYEIAQTPYLVRAVLSGIFRPRRAKFKVTSKEETVEHDRLSEMSRPLMILFALMLAGIGMLIWRWINLPGDREILKIVGGWMIFNTIFVGAALRVLVEKQQRRTVPRVAVDLPVFAALADKEMPTEVTARIIDISATGARVQILPGPQGADISSTVMGRDMRLAPAIDLGIPGLGAVDCQIANVRFENGMTTLGVSFDPDPQAAGFATIAAMLNGDSARWQKIRSQQAVHRGVLVGFAAAIGMAMRGVVATLWAMLTHGRPTDVSNHSSTPNWGSAQAAVAHAFIDTPAADRDVAQIAQDAGRFHPPAPASRGTDLVSTSY